MTTVRKYIFDFAILFIGITSAFYVENFRQDNEDKENLHKYLQGLVDDLKSDSIIYEEARVTLNNSRQNVDSLLLITDNDQIENKIKIRLLANSTLLIYDIGIDNNTNYKTLINSGQLKLIDDINYRKELKDYYRKTEVWLKDYDLEFRTFRTNELFPFLNNSFDLGDFYWDKGLKIVDDPKTNPKIFKNRQLKNYLFRTRQYLHDFGTTMEELKKINIELKRTTEKKLGLE